MKYLIVVCILISRVAFAGCYVNGQEYPEGTEINGYTCSASGSWV